MNPLGAERFDEFYRAVHGYLPFPWQSRLAKQVCAGSWPKAIALPTAAGKTACIDIAVFALACGASEAPRRIFFVVDRRIVVDQAFLHADALAKALDRAPEGVLLDAADRLRDRAEPGWMEIASADRLRILAKRWQILDESDSKKRQKLIDNLSDLERLWYDIRPLDVYALRGGMYRETAWTRSPLQPTVIASTVDQVGSRLLFRGYGVSDSMKPVHAGLVGNDAIILLDEAHCAKPFQQTADAVAHYRGWTETQAPFKFVTITATPTDEIREAERKRAEEHPNEPKLIFADDEADRAHKILGARIAAKKPAALVVSKKNKLLEDLKSLAEAQMGLGLGVRVIDGKEVSYSVRAVGIIVNRVKTARELAKLLRELKPKKGEEPSPRDVILLTGRMRPVDRDLVLKRLAPLFSGSKVALEKPTFVVATQCLEVGADLDFHALVTECASLDSLRQRFGRLNRVADRPSAKAVVVCREEFSEPKEKEKEQDPIYGNSLPNAWKFLTDEGKRTEFDFGVSAMELAVNGVDLTEMNAPSADAPVLFPAHLDCWVQTHPIPTPDPEPALFLHGPQKPGQPDVQVVFRDDLGADETKWAEIVGLCPPSSSEAVAVPIGLFKKWLAGEKLDSPKLADDTGDVETGTPDAESEESEIKITQHTLRWMGSESEKTQTISTPSDVWPTQTYIVPCDAKYAGYLGDLGTLNQDDPPADYAEAAYLLSRDKALIRLHGFDSEEDDDDYIETLNASIKAKIAAEHPTWPERAIASLMQEASPVIEYYPEPKKGRVVRSKKRLGLQDPTYLDDSEPDDSSKSKRSILLVDHSRGVAECAARFAKACGLPEELFRTAGLLHDLGKLDPRFQRMLNGHAGGGAALAKSKKGPRNREERDAARTVHRYPKGSRHELLSAAIAAEHSDDDDLLHLIATHHGSGRPFANAVEENDAAKPFDVDHFGVKLKGFPCTQAIAEWNAELPERFWRTVRKHGWWGTAYREAIFRLADHAQSRAEQEGEVVEFDGAAPAITGLSKGPKAASFPLPLPGLDGSNPLAFLAALGTLRVCEQLAERADAPAWLKGTVRLSWGHGGSDQVPVLRLPGPSPTDADFADYIGAQLARTVDVHPSAWAIAMLQAAVDDKELALPSILRPRCLNPAKTDRIHLDWVNSLVCESAPEAASQLQTVRRDYLLGNFHAVLARTSAEHVARTLFAQWDYADALSNQSLHWEPTEDRRHAYQWHTPSGDPTRNRSGGMLGANRLALESFPLFPCFPKRDRIATRGFTGSGMFDTFWAWPLWSSPWTSDAVAAALSLPDLQTEPVKADDVRGRGIAAVFRAQRILVGKTPNLTQATLVG